MWGLPVLVLVKLGIWADSLTLKKVEVEMLLFILYPPLLATSLCKLWYQLILKEFATFYETLQLVRQKKKCCITTPPWNLNLRNFEYAINKNHIFWILMKIDIICYSLSRPFLWIGILVKSSPKFWSQKFANLDFREVCNVPKVYSYDCTDLILLRTLLPSIILPLFINKRFVLNEIFQQNASKFAIFYV